MRRVEAVVVLAVITAAFYTGLDRVRFHTDESAWIGLSATFEAFFTGRFRDPIWQERQDKLVVAPVTLYVTGAARRIGGFPPERLNLPWRWSAPYEVNAAEGRVPEPRLLWWGRAGVTTAAIVGIFVFFALLLRAAGRPAAYAWLALALVNPYLRETLRRAMNEGALLCFLALVTWATARALPHLDRPADAPGIRRKALAWRGRTRGADQAERRPGRAWRRARCRLGVPPYACAVEPEAPAGRPRFGAAGGRVVRDVHRLQSHALARSRAQHRADCP